MRAIKAVAVSFVLVFAFAATLTAQNLPAAKPISETTCARIALFERNRLPCWIERGHKIEHSAMADGAGTASDSGLPISCGVFALE